MINDSVRTVCLFHIFETVRGGILNIKEIKVVYLYVIYMSVIQFNPILCRLINIVEIVLSALFTISVRTVCLYADFRNLRDLILKHTNMKVVDVDFF